MGPMKLLLIESDPGSATPIHQHLVDEGHEVLSCNDEFGGPCRGVADHVECPLHSHVDLAIVARTPDDRHSLNEMGSVCASQRRVPIVEVDPAIVDDEMPSVVVAGALATRKVEAAYAAAVRHELGDIETDVEVHRQPSRIHVTLRVPATYTTAPQLSAVADRARHAIRSFDPFVAVIDVSVATSATPAE